MIAGTAGVSPLRLLRPAHDDDRARLLGLGWRPAGRDVVSPEGLFWVRVRHGDDAVEGVAARFGVTDPPVRAGLLPHERTDERAVRRRLRALRTAHVDRDPLLLTFRGRGRLHEIVDGRTTPVHRHTAAGTADSAVEVAVSQVEAEAVPAVLAALAGARLLVADGHHRLAASVLLSREGAAAHVTGLAVDADRTPFRLGPIHRVVLDDDGREQLPEGAAAELVERCRMAGAHVAQLPAVPVAGPAGGDRGVVVLQRDRAWSVTWPGHPGTDVTSLVEHVLADEQGTRTRREPLHATALAAAAHGAVTVLLPPPSFDEVLGMAERGALLPYKATAFEPKVPSGALVRPLPAWFEAHPEVDET